MKKFIPKVNEDPMVMFCRMTVEARYEDLPQNVIDFSKQLILDTVGNMIGGSAFDGILPVVEMVKEKGGKPESYIPFYGGKVPASEAGMALAPMARAIDFAAIHPEAMHSTEHNLPALLASAGLKNKVSGKELLTAYAMAQEVIVRIGTAYRGNLGVTLGRSNGHYIFGVVAGVGKLLGLNQEQLENAMGIGRSMTQPHDMACFHPPTHMIKVHHGFIAQDAINCCLLALRGITGPRQDVLLEPKGYLGFAKWKTDPDALTRDIGEKWEQMNVELKHFLGCKCGHTAMLAVLNILEENDLQPDKIEKIDVDESSLNYSVMSGPVEEKLNPKDIYECQFSIPYLVATVAYDKDPVLESFDEVARSRPHVRDLMNRISIKLNPDLAEWGAKVVLTTKDGAVHSKVCYVEELKGGKNNPYNDTDLAIKFKKCVPYSAYKLSDKVVDKLLDSMFNLEKVEDVVAELIVPLTPM